MTKPTCKEPTCERPRRARGWCSAHYKRWREHGDPLVGGPLHWRNSDLAERFWSKVCAGAPGACWLWLPRSRTSQGYGNLGVNGKTVRSHRVAWELTYGAVPDGLHVLHHCDNPSCCNPGHLWLGTNTDNVMDRESKKRGRNSRNTHCPQRHPYSGDNLFVSGGSRRCRICHQDAYLRFEAKKREMRQA